MKKFIIISFLISSVLSSSNVFAAEGVIKPTSKFYFLQSWGESIRLLLTFSKEGKMEYLLKLAERRVDEIKNVPSATIASRYEEHFKDLSGLASEAKNKEEAIEKIQKASISQQEVLSNVYAKVPDEAKDAILNAQENSSKNVARVIEAVNGTEKAQEYIQEVARIQQVEKMEKTQRLERAAMEGSPNAEPSQSVPKELKPGQELKQLNPVYPGQQGGGEDVNRAEPAAPVPMEQPVGQY